MKIVLAKNLSFCTGVNHSINKTNELLDSNSQLYCLGELVHNEIVISNLEKKGLKIINEDDIDNLNNEKIIIRAHGIKKDLYDKLKNNTIIDLTCPKVLKIHDLAEKLNKDNYMILIGVKTHPEVIGTISYCGKNSIIIEKEEDLDKIVIDENIHNIAIISQTTFSLEKFNHLVDLIKKRYDNYKIAVYNTICNTTRMRQDEVEKLSKTVDCMLIIGSKTSSNTLKLYDIAKSITKTFLIENLGDFDPNILNFDTIGIASGASTPMVIINDIVNYLENHK